MRLNTICDRVVESKVGFQGRFAILLPFNQEAILFGTASLWEQKQDEEFHLHLSRGCGYALPQREMHSAYVGEISKDFWLDD